MGIPSGADIGDEIAKEPFIILLNIYAALVLGSIQGMGDALFVMLCYIWDQELLFRRTSICSGFL